jgi:hypothetical protein
MSVPQIDHKLTVWEPKITRFGIFLIFLVTFGQFVLQKISPVVKPLVEWVRDLLR